MGASTAPRQANIPAPGISAAAPDRSFRAFDPPGEAARVVLDHHKGVETRGTVMRTTSLDSGDVFHPSRSLKAS